MYVRDFLQNLKFYLWKVLTVGNVRLEEVVVAFNLVLFVNGIWKDVNLNAKIL